MYFLYFSIYSTCKTYIEWQANPTITTINTTAFPIKNIEFPAVTICSQGSARDVMDTVLLNQFEEYLKSRGVKKGTLGNSSKKGKSSGKRKKRATETPKLITNTLTDKEVNAS